MDADSKLQRFREITHFITDAHDQDEKEVRRMVSEMRKIVDQAEAGIPAGRKAYAERMAAEAARKAKIKADAEAGKA